MLNYTLRWIFKIVSTNPTLFKFMVLLRNDLLNYSLKIKSILYRWEYHRKPTAIEKSAQKYAQEKGFSYQPVNVPMAPPRKPPNTIHPSVDKEFNEKLNPAHNALFCIEIPKGRVLSQGFVVTPENKILEEVSMLFDSTRPIYKPIDDTHTLYKSDLAEKPVERVKGSLAVLATPSAWHNYYHWMMELIPRVKIIEAAGYDLSSIDSFYVNTVASQFQQESLKAVGIPSRKIVDGAWHPHLQADTLIVPSKMGSNGDFGPLPIQYLRDLFLPAQIKPASRKIYINRNQARHRRILNEPELEQYLTGLGFESISLENMSIAEQASLMASAKVIISGHGAGLTNLVFCQQDSFVIELFEKDNIYPIYWGICNVLSLNYFYLKSNKEISDNPTGKNSNYCDMKFDLDDFKKIVQSVIDTAFK